MNKKTEKITSEALRWVLDYDPATGDFTWLVRMSQSVKAGSKAGSVDKVTGYLRIGIHGANYKAHQLAWLYVYGEFPADQIDHINHVRTDNRILNLRAVSRSENQRNSSQRKDNTSGHTGVHRFRRDGKWQAQIRVKGKLLHLGLFTLEEDAVLARKAAEIKYGFHPNHGKP